MLNNKHKGARAELAVVNWLFLQGYEVFRNMSQHGPADLIALDPVTKETHLIDVKTASPKQYSTIKGPSVPKLYVGKLNPLQRSLGVRLVLYFPDMNECKWHEELTKEA